MILAVEHFVRQPGLIGFRTIGAIRPIFAARIVSGDAVLEHLTIGMVGCGGGARSYETELAIDGDVRIITEGRDRDHRHGRSIRTIACLTANFQRPTGAGFLLRPLVRLIGPDSQPHSCPAQSPLSFPQCYAVWALPPMSRPVARQSNTRIRRECTIWPPMKCDRQKAVEGDVALLFQLPVKHLHHPLLRAVLRELFAE